MLRRLIAPFAVLACAALSAPAQTPPRPSDVGSTQLLVCAPGYPGTAKQAQTIMDELAKQLTARAGWQPGRLTARYVATEKEGLEAIKQRPAWLLTTTEFFCKHVTAIDGTVIASTQLKSGTSERFWLMLPKGVDAAESPTALKPRTLFGTRLLDPVFTERVVLAGVIRMEEFGRIQREKRTLRAVKRATAAPETGALWLSGAEKALLDQPALKSKLDGWEPYLRSEPVPSAPVLALRRKSESASATVRREQFKKALYSLNSTDQGKALCTKMRMLGFVPPDTAKYAKAVKRYHPKKKDDDAKDD